MKNGLNVLVTGQHGFLLQNIIPNYNWNIIPYKSGQIYNDIDLIIHFASPTDKYDFLDKKKMAETMINLTINIVNEAKTQNKKLIFASSCAAEFLDDEYGIYKRSMEQYISAILNDYLILRIPRIYGKDKNKGLMKRIKLNDIDDWNKQVSYVDIHDFIEWFNSMLNKSGIQSFNGNIKINTIKEIKEIYCEF